MSLNDCMSKHTHRQYQTWMQWLENQWNNPTLSDHYLMQITAEVRRVLSKDPSRILTQDFKLTFSKESEKKPLDPKSIEEATARSKSFWGALTGSIRRAINGSGDGNRADGSEADR